MECMGFFSDPDQNLQLLQPISQFIQKGKFLPGRVGLYDEFDDVPAHCSQFAPQSVFVIAAEIPDGLLEIDSLAHGLLIN